MFATVANFATRSSPFVANPEHAFQNGNRYPAAMFASWLRSAMDHAKISGAELGRLMTEKLGRSIDRAAVQKMLMEKATAKTKPRKIAADELVAISEITGYSLPDREDRRTVRVIGHVAAGDAAFFDDGHGEEVDPPPGATDKTVAAEVRGESLGPLFDNALIFYDEIFDPPHDGLAGKLCIVRLTDGRTLVKQIKRGQIPHSWTLMSNSGPPIYDQQVEWAARVIDIRPR